jgi:hypothetical protein
VNARTTLTRRSNHRRRRVCCAPAQPLPPVPRRLRDGEAPAGGRRRDGAHGARRVGGAPALGALHAARAPARSADP